MDDKNIDWHHILQGIFDEHLEMMSGKHIVESGREVHQHFQIDYFCRVEPGQPRGPKVEGILPFDHFLEFNLIEYKSINETLNEAALRNYIGRAMMFGSRQESDSLKGRLTLNILLTREPTALLKNSDYHFEQVQPWKYRMEFAGIAVYLLIQREMRGIDGGEPLAWLQVLEGNKKYQKAVWSRIMAQELTGANQFKRIMISINKEGFMSMLRQIRQQAVEEARPAIRQQAVEEARPNILREGETRGKQNSLLTLLENFGPSLLPAYRSKIQNAETLEECDRLEQEIYADIRRQSTAQ